MSCKIEGCELHHCKKCGGHYDPYFSEGGDVCDECIINEAAATAEAQAEIFDGNYEKANEHFGW